MECFRGTYCGLCPCARSAAARARQRSGRISGTSLSGACSLRLAPRQWIGFATQFVLEVLPYLLSGSIAVVVVPGFLYSRASGMQAVVVPNAPALESMRREHAPPPSGQILPMARTGGDELATPLKESVPCHISAIVWITHRIFALFWTELVALNV
jgi:hypothetical protein